MSEGKPLPIDNEKSCQWAISELAGVSVSLGKVGVGISLFDLVNRSTGRAQKMALYRGGRGLGLAVGGSISASPYGCFTTPRPVNFNDFDGIWMEICGGNAIVYSTEEVTLYDGPNPFGPRLGRTTMSGTTIALPEVGTAHGLTSVIYNRGGRMNDPGGVMMIPPKLKLATHEETTTKVKGASQNAYHLPGDALFDFNKSDIKQTTAWALQDAADFIKQVKDPGAHVYITGHTDSVGDAGYNKALSKRRADAVAKWLVDNKVITAAEAITHGEGASKPIESNMRPDGKPNPYGQEKNRRVELMVM